MSFYRTLIAVVAAMGLATAAFAADEATTSTTTTDTSTKTVQIADSSSSQDATATQGTDQEKVNVNKATVKELMKVKGLNAAKARAIVSYRKKHGDFKTLEDLKMVKGFKKMNDDNMKKIEDQLTIG